MAGWTKELVWITADDGVEHDGVVPRPTSQTTDTAVVWMDGSTFAVGAVS